MESYLAESCAHCKVHNGIDARVGKAEKIDTEHCKKELTMSHKVVSLQLGDDSNKKVRTPADHERKHHHEDHLGNLGNIR